MISICKAKADGSYEVEGKESSGFKLADGLHTYALINETGDIPDHHMEHMALNFAITHWELYIEAIRFKHVKATDNPEITVEFNTTDPLFKDATIIGYSYYPDKSNPNWGKIVFNDNHNFSLDGSNGTINLVQTLTHEFGHKLGLVHIQNSSCIMYPVYHNDYEFCTAEITDVKMLYGDRNIPQHIIDSFLKILFRVFPKGSKKDIGSG